MTRERSQDKESGIFGILVLILVLRICSYFMISESVAVTQVFKTSLRLLLTVTSGIMLVNAANRNTIKLHSPAAILLYIAYLVAGAVSLFWTTSFSSSLLHLLMDAETLVFCLLFTALIVNNSEIRLSKMLSISVFIVAAGFMIGRFLNPDMFFRLTHGGEEARLGGFIINPNELGMLLVVGIAASINEWNKSNRIILACMTVVMCYDLFLTGSRSSIVGLLLIILFYISFNRSWKKKIAVIVSIMLIAPFIFHSIILKQGNVDEVMNMTGRVPFWKDLLTINFPKEPILGYGYMRIDYMDKFESVNSYAGAMTHNTFLQVLMGLGLTGLFIVLMQLAATLRTIAYSGRLMIMTSVGVLIPVLVNSFTEFGIFGETNYGILFYLIMIFTISLKTCRTFPAYKQQE